MDPATLGDLLDKHAAALELYARQWCSVPEDVVQEAFVRLAQQSPVPRQVVPWLYRVVRNAAISAGRADQRRRHRERRAAIRTDWFVRGADSTTDTLAVTDALAYLPLEQREVIVAHLWGGLSFSEIAEVLNTTSSTAHRRYAAGLEALRESLGYTCRHPA